MTARIRHGLLLCALAAATPTAQAQESAPPSAPPLQGLVRVTLKFVRREGGAAPPSVRLVAATCPACVQRFDPAYARDNAREAIAELDVPRGRSLELAFDTAPKAFRRVILEAGDTPFRVEGGLLVVDLPPLEADAVNAGQVFTHVRGAGHVLRFEHDDPARRAGAYAAGVLPAQRHAADNLEFAEREAVLELGLGETVRRDELGIIEIQGFETNFSHGHLDSPPHVHMHLRWPYNIGTQIGHFYLTEKGLIARNTAGATGLRLSGRTYGPGEIFSTVSAKGTVAYSQTITPVGGLRLSLADGRACELTPLGEGFDTGAQVACSDHPPVTIQVQDDLVRGRIEVRTGEILEVFRYDTDTGALLSPAAPPPEGASEVVPTFHLESRFADR